MVVVDPNALVNTASYLVPDWLVLVAPVERLVEVEGLVEVGGGREA